MPGTVIGMYINLMFFFLLSSSPSLMEKKFVTDVRVKEGDHVEKGQPLVVLSAMKMEMVVQSPIAGTVKKLEISNGMKLEGEDLLLTFE